MNKDLFWNLVFIILCIGLLAIMLNHYLQAEKYKKNIVETCLGDKNRVCYCQGGKDVLEKNSTHFSNTSSNSVSDLVLPRR